MHRRLVEALRRRSVALSRPVPRPLVAYFWDRARRVVRAVICAAYGTWACAVLFARIRMAGTRRGLALGRMGLERFRKMVKSG